MSARTAARSALVALALAVALAIGALLGVAASPAPEAEAVQVTAPAVEVAPAALDLSYGEPFLVALLGEGTDLHAGQAEAFVLAADRVCEAFTAEVPLVVVADTVAGEFGFTDEEARSFVNTAGVVHCSAE